MQVLVNESLNFAIAASVVFFSLGLGMIYVTWLNPSSRLHRVFCARWRLFGRTASRFGAAAQALTYLALGVLILLSALGSRFTKIAFIPLAAGVILTGIARLGDLRDDEA